MLGFPIFREYISSAFSHRCTSRLPNDTALRCIPTMSNNLATTVISTFAYSMAFINVSITGSKILALLTSTRLGCPWLRGSVLGSTAEGELRGTLASWTTMRVRKSTTIPSMSSLSRRSLVQVVLSHLVLDHSRLPIYFHHQRRHH